MLKSSFLNEVEICGARGSVDIKKIPLDIFIFDSSLIFGKEHILAAYFNAKRNFQSGRNISSKMHIEIMLYLAGTRQINIARKMYEPKKSGKYAIIYPKNFDIENFLEEFSLERDDSVMEITEEKVSSLNPQGIFKENPLGYILEKMCLLNLQI